MGGGAGPGSCTPPHGISGRCFDLDHLGAHVSQHGTATRGSNPVCGAGFEAFLHNLIRHICKYTARLVIFSGTKKSFGKETRSFNDETGSVKVLRNRAKIQNLFYRQIQGTSGKLKHQVCSLGEFCPRFSPMGGHVQTSWRFRSLVILRGLMEFVYRYHPFRTISDDADDCKGKNFLPFFLKRS